MLEERETTEQYARVIEMADGERRLELNEGQVFHSTWRRGHGAHRRVLRRLPVDAASVLGRPPRSVAVLGNGAGTAVRAYGEFYPRTEMDGVEIDGELTELGRRWFGLRDRPACTCTPTTRGRSCARATAAGR